MCVCVMYRRHKNDKMKTHGTSFDFEENGKLGLEIFFSFLLYSPH